MSAGDLAADVLAGLTATPKALPSKWFYDEAGSKLFDEITRLPEYYPTRAERAILEARAGDVAAASAADTLIELGSGTSEKTRLLLDALRAGATLRRFVPFDVDEVTLGEASAALSREYPGVEVHPVVGDFETGLARLDRREVGGDRRLIAFLGSTIGNLDPAGRALFLSAVAAVCGPGDSFLVGTDLVKDPRRIEAAYNDAAGVTAEFNLNLLARINAELDADFDMGAFTHVARFDPDAEWVDVAVRSERDQTVHVGALGLTVRFAAGEEMRTEISAKFRVEGVAAELAAAGLAVVRTWTDHRGDFAVTLAAPAQGAFAVPGPQIP